MPASDAVSAEPVLVTEHLCLRELREDDAPFMRELLQDPGWKRFIGDRGDCSLAQAKDYIVTGPLAMYAREGFGLWHLGPHPDRDTSGEASFGLCGLIRREGLADVDIGFALLERHTGRGYAYEAARAVLAYARDRLGLPRVVAITDLDNAISGRLLLKLGLEPRGRVRLKPESPELLLYGIDFEPRTPALEQSRCSG